MEKEPPKCRIASETSGPNWEWLEREKVPESCVPGITNEFKEISEIYSFISNIQFSLFGSSEKKHYDYDCKMKRMRKEFQ